MSSLSELAAFRAAVELLKDRGMENVLEEVWKNCKETHQDSPEHPTNYVKRIYENFTDKEIADKMSEMLTPKNVKAKVKLIFQSLEGLHKAVPNHPGDWYFSGDYPTPGGVRMVNRAYINYYEGHADLR